MLSEYHWLQIVFIINGTNDTDVGRWRLSDFYFLSLSSAIRDYSMVWARVKISKNNEKKKLFVRVVSRLYRYRCRFIRFFFFCACVFTKGFPLGRTNTPQRDTDADDDRTERIVDDDAKKNRVSFEKAVERECKTSFAMQMYEEMTSSRPSDDELLSFRGDRPLPTIRDLMPWCDAASLSDDRNRCCALCTSFRG